MENFYSRLLIFTVSLLEISSVRITQPEAQSGKKTTKLVSFTASRSLLKAPAAWGSFRQNKEAPAVVPRARYYYRQDEADGMTLPQKPRNETQTRDRCVRTSGCEMKPEEHEKDELEWRGRPGGRLSQAHIVDEMKRYQDWRKYPKCSKVLRDKAGSCWSSNFL